MQKRVTAGRQEGFYKELVGELVRSEEESLIVGDLLEEGVRSTSPWKQFSAHHYQRFY